MAMNNERHQQKCRLDMWDFKYISQSHCPMCISHCSCWIMSLPLDILFAGLVSDMEEENDSCPLIKTEECTFAYIKVRGVTIVTEVVIVSVTAQVSNVYIVATTRSNTNIAMLFSLLHRVTQVRD